jgi:hypothetical protein
MVEKEVSNQPAETRAIYEELIDNVRIESDGPVARFSTRLSATHVQQLIEHLFFR